MQPKTLNRVIKNGILAGNPLCISPSIAPAQRLIFLIEKKSAGNQHLHGLTGKRDRAPSQSAIHEIASDIKLSRESWGMIHPSIGVDFDEIGI
jgi:hypothetical protein